jgi:hypothetical protein
MSYRREGTRESNFTDEDLNENTALGAPASGEGSLDNLEKPISLDEIFDKIGMGPYQFRVLICMSLVAFSEGAQIIISALCMTIL